MSEFDELDVLVAIRDVGVDQIALDRLDRRLATAFSETPSPGHRRPRARHVGRLILAVGVLVPVLVVVATVALLSGSNRPVAPPASSSGANASAGTRQLLLRTLGVLRRPPNAASRMAISCLKSSPNPGSAAFRACRTSAISLALPFPGAQRFGASSGVRLDTSLIRVVPIPQSGNSIALMPATARASPGSPRRAEGLDIIIASQNGAAASPGPTPTSVSELRTHGLAVSGTNATPTMRSVAGAVIVPDGVATVTLQPVRLISPPAPVDPRRFGTSTTSVHDNIATYRFTVPYVQDPRQNSLVYAVNVVARATWRDRHGTVIAHTTTRLRLWLKVRGNNGPITATN